jgi:PTH1 family peptidyl-tRNA hydrolase
LLQKLVVGLGNPGPRYAATRHNIGFRVVEAFARERGLVFPPPGRLSRMLPKLFPPHGADGYRLARGEVARQIVGVLEPLRYMNRSGEAAAAIVAENPAIDVSRDLLVVYDDLDLPLGRIRLRAGGGAGGHRGVGSMIDELDTQAFPRLRFGIGRPEPGGEIVSFVLEPFATADDALLETQVKLAVEAASHFVVEGIAATMDRFNAAGPPAVTGDASST